MCNANANNVKASANKFNESALDRRPVKKRMSLSLEQGVGALLIHLH